MKVTVCIGSSCHLKGSRPVVEQLQSHIPKHSHKGKADRGATLCKGECSKGVCVTVDGQLFSVSPDTVTEFFEKEILAKVG